ncbi:MAG: hypothetical protein DHS20C16_10330 [Phycisphaerae bacterium]|nr:MAG: hypothetical protein DHS20C16_10330 [Phycisphaerae bacterium]
MAEKPMTLSMLVVQTGSAYSEIVSTSGDYAAWFRDAFCDARVEMTVVDALGDELPMPAAFDAIILTGSSHSVTDSNPRLLAYQEWIRGLAESEVPTLGVCFGHQVMAAAFGGCVERHEAGRQFGAVAVTLNDAGKRDFLFQGVGSDSDVHSCHEDVCTRLPEAATLLASSKRTVNQSFAIGEYLRAVQFHPEVTTTLIQQLHDGLVSRGLMNSVDAEIQSSKAQAAGQRILANFLQFAMEEKHASSTKMLDPNPR